MTDSIHYAIASTPVATYFACGKQSEQGDLWTTAAALVSCSDCLRSSAYARRAAAHGLGRLGDAPVPEHTVRVRRWGPRCTPQGPAYREYLAGSNRVSWPR